MLCLIVYHVEQAIYVTRKVLLTKMISYVH